MIKDEFGFVSFPPVNKPFSNMSCDEAAAFFSWHISTLSCRLSNMSKVLNFKLEYTPESLVILWSKILKYRKKKHASSGDSDEFESMLSCAGLYLAEVFVRNNPSIKWICNRDSEDGDFFKNKPVLDGFHDKRVTPPFRMLFEPYHMIHVQALKIDRGIAHDTDLLDLYRVWFRYI